ncbi:MAG: hypothetical protein JWN50_113 [Parcubacteria group bacterium]|nr:hypothetical protein [Parcubacteria group bacterium]
MPVYGSNLSRAPQRRKTGLLLKLGAQVALLLVGGIPTWLFLLIKHLANPTGFWQNLVLYGLGFWVGGAIQLLLLIAVAAFSFIIWTEM